MKIFIYNNLAEDSVIQRNNTVFADLHRLHPHLGYMKDVLELCRQFETTNPDEADYFFVPLFITGFQWMNIDPLEYINRCTYLDRGKHIIVSTGDVGQRAESVYEMTRAANPNRAYNTKYKWLDNRFIIVALESVPTLLAQDIAILPYQSKSVTSSYSGDRNILLSFMGALSHLHLPETHIRGGRLVEFKNRFHGGDIVIVTPDELAGTTYHDLMAKSVFTLCPAGYGRWTFRFIEALLNGSIPVIVSDNYILPFSDTIDWAKYAYIVAESDLFDIPAILRDIDENDIAWKQNNINKDKHIFEKQFTMTQIENKLAGGSESYADAAIRSMRGPEHMAIICIDVTNKCDLSCSNCTRLLKNQDEFWEMTPENFRLALRSLKGFQGIIAMIGGNPCTHSQFPDLCRVFQEEIPNQKQRGLWTNNIFKHNDIIEETFGGLNLNPHNKERAIGPLKALYDKMVTQRGFNGGFYVGHSHHAPILTAVKDLYPDEKTMWDKIKSCDINREWSASIVQNKGEIRAYFCEVAASFDLARGTDHGLVPHEGWWRRPITDFGTQIKRFCPGCGVSARLKGHMDHENTDTYTQTNADLAEKSKARKNRNIVLLGSEAETLDHRMTKYAS